VIESVITMIAGTPSDPSAAPLEARDDCGQAGAELLVAVCGPDVLAEGGRQGEAVRGQGAQERVQLAAGCGVLDELLAR
jgi:hypothetical protein